MNPERIKVVCIEFSDGTRQERHFELKEFAEGMSSGLGNITRKTIDFSGNISKKFTPIGTLPSNSRIISIALQVPDDKEFSVGSDRENFYTTNTSSQQWVDKKLDKDTDIGIKSNNEGNVRAVVVYEVLNGW